VPVLKNKAEIKIIVSLISSQQKYFVTSLSQTCFQNILMVQAQKHTCLVRCLSLKQNKEAW